MVGEDLNEQSFNIIERVYIMKLYNLIKAEKKYGSEY